MKYLILVGDGMGDHPIAELGECTPLEVADIPFMDDLCSRGKLLLVQTVPPGFPPGSDVANLSLLGYDPARYYTGRAPFEAAAMGIETDTDETAFRCNLVTLEKYDDRVIMVDFSAGHISSEEAAQLMDALNDGCGNEQFRFHNGISYRHILMVKGDYPAMEPVPPHDHIDRDVSRHWQRYFEDPDWKKLLETSENILKNHPVNQERLAQGKRPANAIWLWGEGKLPQMPAFHNTFGLTGSMISAVDLLKGLGVTAGLSVIHVQGATGYLDTNYRGKADAALSALVHQDFVFVHVEAPDEAGHQGLVKEKIRAIEDFDQKIVRPIFEGLQARGEDFRAIVTMDHMTPVALRTHTSEPIPAILYDSREKLGSKRSFSERACLAHQAKQEEGLVIGHTLLRQLIQV